MLVKISNGHVTLRDTISRKAWRNYQRILLTDARREPIRDKDGQPVVDEHSGIPLTITLPTENGSFDAKQALVVSLIESAVVDDKPVSVIDEAFVEGLERHDYDLVEIAVIKIKNGLDEDEKKSSGTSTASTSEATPETSPTSTPTSS